MYNLAYLAGIIDGEGCISIIAHSQNGQGYCNPRYRVRLLITNTSKELMLWLKREFGFYWLKHSSTTGSGKQCYKACLMDRKACSILRNVMPYLVIKKEEGRTAIALQDHKDSLKIGRNGLSKEQVEYRESLKCQLHELKCPCKTTSD